MPSESFLIRELTGSQRSIELFDRALPYRPVMFPREQHFTQRWYPGNPVATIQVLGPRQGNVEIRGTWKTRYIATMATFTGFGELVGPLDAITAEILVTAFARVCDAGNLVEVRWGPEVRRGILHKFEPNYQRVEDIEWIAVFVWSQEGTRPRVRAARVPAPSADMLSALNALDDVAAVETSFEMALLEALEVHGAIEEIRTLALLMVTHLREIEAIESVSSAHFAKVDALTIQITILCNSLITFTIDRVYLDFIPVDTPGMVMHVENYKRVVGNAARRLLAVTLRARDTVAQRVVPDYLDQIVVRQNENLRNIARRYYGNADEWTLIADANGLVFSSVSSGTVIIIPKPPELLKEVRIKL